MPSRRRSNAAELRGRQGRQRQGVRRAAKQAPTPRSAEANDIIGVLLLALAAAMAVALLLTTPAPVTQKAGEFLSWLFGRGALLCPLSIALFALTFFADGHGPLSGHVALGLLLMLLAILSLMSLSFPGGEADPDLVLSKEVLFNRGGYVGGAIAWGLLKSVGFGVGVVLLSGIILVGLVVCGFSISGAIAHIKAKASDAGSSLHEARERHFEELRQRKAERAQKRIERRNARAAASPVIEQDWAGQDEWEDASESDPTTPATSFIGARKTTVLRRHKKPIASSEPVNVAEDDAGERAQQTQLTQRLTRSKKSDSKSKKDKTASIPEFLRAQFVEQDELPYDEDASATTTESLQAPKAQRKQSKTPTSSAVNVRTQAQSIHARPGDSTQEFKLPPFEMLSSNPHSAQSASTDAELTSTMRRLQSTLSEFGLSSKVVDYVSGPLVTTFQVEMGEGERVNKIVNLEDDIALTLAAESVRIFAPIPGTSRVGIEIPNKKRESVCIGDVLPYAKGGPLEFAVGRDAGGKAVIADLAKMPHLLVAGSTGSGKSVMINSLIMSILMRDTPKQVRLILVDPKRVEFSGYNGLPHLYVPVVTEPRQAASALQWAVSEMERRLKVFERAGARNITIYNEMCTTGKLSEMDNPPEPMPFMVIIIDELSDLMMVAGKDVEASIVRIAQLARAAGIHLVLATQRPSADVVTGLIKSNIETRIALSVASSMDSRVILDQTGADRLLGNGDMLFKFRGHRTRRILGCYVADAEIESVVAHWCDQGEPDYHEEILTQVIPGQPSNGASTADDEDDPLVWQAAQIVVESQLGSTSGLQRRLKVGYARAGRIMDMLAAKGIVGPPDGSKPREVLLDEDGLEQLKEAEQKFREV